MLRKNISLSEFRDTVIRYEEQELLSSFVSNVGDNMNIVLFRGRRRQKIAVISTHKFPTIHLSSLLAKVADAIDATPSISDNIDFFTSVRLTSDMKESLSALALRDFSLSVSIIDGSFIEQHETFKTLWDETENSRPLDETEKSLYDYLSVSNDSTDIKNGIYYSLLLLIIHKHGSVTETVLKSEMKSRFGRDIVDIRKDIAHLRKVGKIKSDKIELTNEETENVRKAENEAKAVEAEFISRFEELTSLYKLNDHNSILEALRQIYVISSNYDISDGDMTSGKIPDEIRKAYNHLEQLLRMALGDSDVAVTVMSSLLKLCAETAYMQRIGMNTAFLNLYRSSRYEEYMNSQVCEVMLDTPVLINFLCAKSGLPIQDDWDDADYTVVKDLAGYKESQAGRVQFIVPYDYLVETFYEYKKALQLTWFSQFDLPIPPESTNVFYNFYQFIRKQKEIYGEIEGQYSFQNFAKEMGFPVLNAEDPTLKRKCLTYLRKTIEVYRCNYIEEIKESYSNFDRVRDVYGVSLEEKGRDKTSYAINADVRQAFYLGNEKCRQENALNEYYFCTWDKTLVPLRDAVAAELLVQKIYSIQTPQALLSKLSFKFFHLAKGSISDTVFTYAEREYSVTTKIRSLYDNILIPYFASVNKGNVRLVVSILDMEKKRWEEESQEVSRMEKRTALEDIFLDVINTLPKRQLTNQNLRDLFSNQEMNDQIVSLFKQAFLAKRDGRPFNLADPLCDMMKEIVVQNEN